MEKQIILLLRQKLNEIDRATNAEILRNATKEELQYYALNFIYHHPKYSKWIMYGGSALRICHGLNRMSVDLDFEIDQKVTKLFLDNFKKEAENYFKQNYELDSDMLIVKEGGEIFHTRDIEDRLTTISLTIDANHLLYIMLKMGEIKRDELMPITIALAEIIHREVPEEEESLTSF